MIPKAREVRLKPKVRKVLEARCRAPSTAQRDVRRARIVLLAAEGRSTRSIAAEVGVQPRIVSHWRRRFAEHGLGGLKDRLRAGKKPIYGKATNKRILALLEKPPPQGYARWTGPLLAKALGDVDVQYVWRFLREHSIDLAARKSWCESNDPAFAAKAADVVGLYVDPPAKAIVLCVDEKPSIQALERAPAYARCADVSALLSVRATSPPVRAARQQTESPATKVGKARLGYPRKTPAQVLTQPARRVALIANFDKTAHFHQGRLDLQPYNPGFYVRNRFLASLDPTSFAPGQSFGAQTCGFFAMRSQLSLELRLRYIIFC
jgi:transposase